MIKYTVGSQIQLVSVIKCVTCQVHFWILKFTDVHEWINSDNTHCDLYLILPSSISVAEIMLISYLYAECLWKVPFHLILNQMYGLIFDQAAMQFIIVKLTDSIYSSHVCEIFVSEK